MAQFIYLSREGYEKLKKELEELKSVKRPEIAQKISDARDFGDLRENAEYAAAKEAMAHLEARISKLEETLRRAKIINKKDIDGNQVSIYTTVHLKDLNRGGEVKYTLVSQEEANFRENKISTNSPVGKALLGKKKGEEVEIRVPAGILKYEIKDIETVL